jgi:multidrug efflux pump subunit AcrA (membrane-fusion protein)
MSSASQPSPAPAGPLPQVAPGPAIVRPPAPKPRRTGAWLLVIVVLLAVAAGAAYYLKVRTAPTGPASPAAASVRTVVVSGGDFQRTLRINGAISAERFASLLVPQLSGRRDGGGFSSSGRSRGGFGDGGSSGGSSRGSSSSSSSGGSSSYSSSTSSFSGSRSGGGSDNNNAGGAASGGAETGGAGITSNATSGASSLGAMRGSTNRFGDRSSNNSSRGNAASNRSSSSSGSSGAMGSSGLGSTSGSLVGGSTGRGTPGGGGGGGGGGFSGGFGGGFGLVLLKLAPAGTRVKKGEIVAEFDRESYLRRLDDYRASFLQTEASMKKQRADMAVAKEAHTQRILVAKANLDKARLDMKTIEVRSAIESEVFKLALEEAEAAHKQILTEVKLFDESQRAQLRIMQIERDQSAIELKRAEANVDRMLLKAPIDGIVVMSSIFRGGEFGQVQEGDQVSPGQQFMQIVDPDSMVINGSVNQVDSESVQLGMKANVRLDGYPDLVLPAKVIGIAAMTKTLGWGRAEHARELPIRLKLERMDPRVIPDLTGSAEIVLSTEQHATMAPLSSIFRDGAARFVFLQSPDGWIRREVELGPANNLYAVVRGGLNRGDVIAAQMPPEPKQGVAR